MPLRAALLLAPMLLLQGSATLRWTPKEGDEMQYRTTGEFSVLGDTVTISSLTDHKVIKVDEDGSFLVQATPLENKVRMGGTEMVGQGLTVLTNYGPNGEIKEIRGDKADATGYRMANLTTFHAPTKAVAVGDLWTTEGKGDPKTGALAWKADYKVVGQEKVDAFDAWKMDVTVRETEGSEGGKAAGTVWVGADGVLVRSELTWSNVTVPGAPATVSGKLTVARVPLAPTPIPPTR